MFVHLETSENAYSATERLHNVYSGATFFASTHPCLVQGLAIITQTWMQVYFIRKSERVRILLNTKFVFTLMQIFLGVEHFPILYFIVSYYF